jgi:hypothetical protein
MICTFYGEQQGMVDERIALLEEMYNASVRRMGLQIPAPRRCLDMAGLLANLEGILIKRSGGPQWLLITYAATSVTVILFDIGRKVDLKEVYYDCNY